jgi:hypothetical protein
MRFEYSHSSLNSTIHLHPPNPHALRNRPRNPHPNTFLHPIRQRPYECASSRGRGQEDLRAAAAEDLLYDCVRDVGRFHDDGAALFQFLRDGREERRADPVRVNAGGQHVGRVVGQSQLLVQAWSHQYTVVS